MHKMKDNNALWDLLTGQEGGYCKSIAERSIVLIYTLLIFISYVNIFHLYYNWMCAVINYSNLIVEEMKKKWKYEFMEG